MNKNYKTIAAFLGYESVASDKENGLYLQEELADKIEARLAEVANIEATLQAKEQELADLNAKLATIEEQHQKALSDSVAEKEAALAEKEAALTAKAEEVTVLGNSIAELKATLATKETEATEKYNTIATLTAKVAEQEQTIAAKEAEITALAEAAPEPQVPAATSEPAAPKKPWAQMTDDEKRAEWGY